MIHHTITATMETHRKIYKALGKAKKRFDPMQKLFDDAFDNNLELEGCDIEGHE